MAQCIPRDRISIAPMINVTNKYQRYMTRLMTAHSTIYTEMLVDDAILHSIDLEEMLDFDESEHPIVAQLGGSNKYKLLKAAKIIEEWGYDEINLNCGCPSPKVITGTFGAQLMLEPWKVYDIVQYLQSHLSIPVTVKCRIGVDDRCSYEDLAAFIRIVSGKAAYDGESAAVSYSSEEEEDSAVLEKSHYGVEHFIIHARTCLLQGLSVKENRRIPALHYEYLFRLLDDFPHIDFTLNGGITSLAIADELLRRRSEQGRSLRGVMIGRMLMKAPWNFHYMDQFFYNTPNPDRSRYETILQYLDFCEARIAQGKSERFSLHELTKPLMYLFTGEKGSGVFRREMQAWLTHNKHSLRESVLHACSFLPDAVLHDKTPGDPRHLEQYTTAEEALFC